MCRPSIFLSALVALAFSLTSEASSARALKLTDVELIQPAQPDTAQKSALNMFAEEALARTGRTWHLHSGSDVHGIGSKHVVHIVAARTDQLPSILPADFTHAPEPCDALERAEGFAIQTLPYHGSNWIVIGAHDDRGMLYGLGYLLRKTQWSRGQGTWEDPRTICRSPVLSVRGHQLGYRAKSNTYDGWTVRQFEQYLRDLAVFGMNTLELLPPITDDEPSSALFPQPAMTTMMAVSGLLKQYGLRCSVFYPALAHDYRDPGTIQAELNSWEAVLSQLPQVDELFIPAGDPGHTDPDVLFAFLQQLAPRLHRHHPQASIWISTQGLNGSQMETFYRLVAAPPPWLAGVVFGPQSRDSVAVQRARIPSALPMRLYPDITHTNHAQFPVPQWDPAFALTEGREPINPQPRAQTQIFRHFAPYIGGFVTYSEGVNDDVNKVIWTALGVDPQAKADETLADYARWFTGRQLGEPLARRFASGLAALERNWDGPLATNPNIEPTLRLFKEIAAAAPAAAEHNWRIQLALYRACFDALQKKRLTEERRQEQQALRLLAQVDRKGSQATLVAANAALKRESANEQPLLAELQKLAAKLFETIRLQLSVARYGASAVSRGANLDTLDVSLTNRMWLLRQLEKIRLMPEESLRREAIHSILQYEHPVAGAYYDDLGEPGKEPHLVQHVDLANDPDLRLTAHDSIADLTPQDGWRRSWTTYAGALYDAPLKLAYDGLDPRALYRVRVTYAGEDYTLPIRLLANDRTELHPFRQRRSNPETVEFDIPQSETTRAHLTLSWFRPPGEGGSGRGCQVAEVWLLPYKAATPAAEGPADRLPN